MAQKYTFEAQIRDIQDHFSDTMENDADVTILEDSLHDKPHKLTRFEKHRVYIEDDHDAGYDVDLQSAAADDSDYSGAVAHGTVTLASGADSGSVFIDGPLGKFRFATRTGALASAPTTGSIRVTVQAWP